jgi:hypothetical protein
MFRNDDNIKVGDIYNDIKSVIKKISNETGFGYYCLSQNSRWNINFFDNSILMNGEIADTSKVKFFFIRADR